MIDLIIRTILEPVFFTAGVYITRFFTFGRWPSEYVKEKYEVLFEFIGSVASIGVVIAALLLIL